MFKSIVVFLFAIASLSTTAFAKSGYQPWQFQCVYDASSDGMITATSKLDPDNDSWTFLLKSSKGPEVVELEAVSAYVYGQTEKTNPETDDAIAQLAKLLKIDTAKWFTTTDITLPESMPMRFFKFNSENGTLGVGIYTNVNGQKYFVKCL